MRGIIISIQVLCDWKEQANRYRVNVRWFQFKYCAIERNISRARCWKRSLFQFKYCAIERKTFFNNLKQIKNFNSSIVRLKEAVRRNFGRCSRISIQVLCDWKLPQSRNITPPFFISIQVLCDWKRICGFKGGGRRANFNSSIVRLKGLRLVFVRFIGLWFQFKYCAIESEQDIRPPAGAMLFQFKYCAIESLNTTAFSNPEI